jgi:type I restriction enzyme S subunit
MGATQDNLSVSKLLSFKVLTPNVETQRKIGAILSLYDDLSENNLRRIKILEEMAQNLYREWFVKFRFPGHQQARFTDSPLGRIPDSWQAKQLGQILELNYGKALKQGDRRDGKVPVYGSSGVVGFHDMPLARGPGIIVGRKGNVGSVFWSDHDFFVSDTAYYVRSQLPLRFLYYELQTKNFLNNDAAVPGLNRNQAYSLGAIVPTSDILEPFCNLCNDFEAQAAMLRRKNATLRSTRDLLLPKLISGELDVSDLAIKVPEDTP